jgi:hypothetical protein
VYLRVIFTSSEQELTPKSRIKRIIKEEMLKMKERTMLVFRRVVDTVFIGIEFNDHTIIH